MVERHIVVALFRERIEIGSNLAVGERGGVDHGDYAVDRYAALDRRPMEGLHQRLRQREAGGLDNDMLYRRRARENLIERRHELVGDSAAEAAVGKLDDILFGAGRVAAAFEEFAVDPDIAELIHDNGEPASVRVRENMADQRRFP
jgi:hypothetical protein